MGDGRLVPTLIGRLGFEVGGVNINYINITNYISSIITQTTQAVAFGHECPKLLLDVHLIDWNPVNHCYVHQISSGT